jgi:hypothetical protein
MAAKEMAQLEQLEATVLEHGFSHAILETPTFLSLMVRAREHLRMIERSAQLAGLLGQCEALLGCNRCGPTPSEEQLVVAIREALKS